MQKIKWSLTEVEIKNILNFEKNPRQIKKNYYKKLENQIDKFGLIDKPIINLDNTLIGGHQRIKILKKKKVSVVTCWVPDRLLTQREVEELCIGLNLHKGEWDFDILANEWEFNDLIEYGFDEKLLLGIIEEDTPPKKEKTTKNCPHCGKEI